MKIKCDLSYFLRDHRKFSLIYIDIEKLKTVGDIISFICKMFNINNFNNCNGIEHNVALYADTWYIHPEQSSHILEGVEDIFRLKIFNLGELENEIICAETNLSKSCNLGNRINKRKKEKKKEKIILVDPSHHEELNNPDKVVKESENSVNENDASNCNARLIEEKRPKKHKDKKKNKRDSESIELCESKILVHEPENANYEPRVEILHENNTLVEDSRKLDKSKLIKDSECNEEEPVNIEEEMVLPKRKRHRKHNKVKKAKKAKIDADKPASQNYEKTFSNQTFGFTQRKSKSKKLDKNFIELKHKIFRDSDDECFYEEGEKESLKDVNNAASMNEAEDQGMLGIWKSPNNFAEIKVKGSSNGFLKEKSTSSDVNSENHFPATTAHEQESLVNKFITNKREISNHLLKASNYTGCAVETHDKFKKLLDLKNSNDPVITFTRKQIFLKNETVEPLSCASREQFQITPHIKLNPPDSTYQSPIPSQEVITKFNYLLMLKDEGKQTPVVFSRTFNLRKDLGNANNIPRAEINLDLLPTSFTSRNSKISNSPHNSFINFPSKDLGESVSEDYKASSIAVNEKAYLKSPVEMMDEELERIKFVGARPKIKNKRYFQSIGNVLKTLKGSLQLSETSEMHETKSEDKINLIDDAGCDTHNEGLLDIENQDMGSDLEDNEEMTNKNEVIYANLDNNHLMSKDVLSEDCETKPGITRIKTVSPKIMDSDKEINDTSNVTPSSIISLEIKCHSPKLEAQEVKKTYYESFHLLPTIPRPGDIIAAKFLGLDDNMCPCYSEYRVAKVTAIEGLKISLSYIDDVNIIKGQPEIIDCENTDVNGIFDWRDLKDVRLLFP